MKWRRWVDTLDVDLGSAGHGCYGEPKPDLNSGLADWGMIREWFDQLRAMLDEIEAGDSMHADLASRHEFWWDSLERLAERARDIEELGGQPLGEEEGRESRSGVALLGGLEDSLVLALADTEGNGDWILTACDVLELANSAQRDGVWGKW